MWPFRRTKAPKLAVVRIGEPSSDVADYQVLTVGQSRLQDSFAALEFTSASPPYFTLSTLTPVVDPRMKTIADVTISIDEYVVGYLRPPALDRAIELLREHRAASLQVPAALVWGPTGPETYILLEDTQPD